jgi:hypothetical protein
MAAAEAAREEEEEMTKKEIYYIRIVNDDINVIARIIGILPP